MKKKLLISFFFVFTIAALQAQEKIRFGAKAGLNFANMTITTLDHHSNTTLKVKPDSRTSIHIGAVVEVPITDAFSIQPELLFNSVGFTQSYSDQETITLKLNYISIPVMGKYYLLEGLALEAGPQIGLLISAKSETETRGAVRTSSTADVKDKYKDLDIGLGIGASYTIDMGVFFSARYVVGLTNIPESSNFRNYKNNVFQLSAGYYF